MLKDSTLFSENDAVVQAIVEAQESHVPEQMDRLEVAHILLGLQKGIPIIVLQEVTRREFEELMALDGDERVGASFTHVIRLYLKSLYLEPSVSSEHLSLQEMHHRIQLRSQELQTAFPIGSQVSLPNREGVLEIRGYGTTKGPSSHRLVFYVSGSQENIDIRELLHAERLGGIDVSVLDTIQRVKKMIATVAAVELSKHPVDVGTLSSSMANTFIIAYGKQLKKGREAPTEEEVRTKVRLTIEKMKMNGKL